MTGAARTVRHLPQPRRAIGVLLSVLAMALATPHGATALAAETSPWWSVHDEVSPTNLEPGQEGEVVIALSDVGDAAVSGGASPVNITNTLPAGLQALAVAREIKGGAELKCAPPQTSPLSCTFAGVLNPYERLELIVKVKVTAPTGTNAVEADLLSVEGGGAPSLSRSLPVTISPTAPSFGVADYELNPFNADGTPARQAAEPPFELTTTLVMNQSSVHQPVALPKDLNFVLPPGLIGNPLAVTRCSEADFVARITETNLCPASSVVGVATITGNEPITLHEFTKTVPVFNLVPPAGEPARFGIDVVGLVPIVIDTSVQKGGDYRVIATVHDATETAGLLSSQVTLWGDPGDPRHNDSRGWECVNAGEFDNEVGKTCPSTSAEPEAPFLRNPTSCEPNPVSEPVLATMETDSWVEPGRYLGAEYAWLGNAGEAVGFTGCEKTPFAPEIDVQPEASAASTPSGFDVSVKMPQQALVSGGGGLAQADVRDTTVMLPEGVQLSPSAANGLLACPEHEENGDGYEGVGFTGFQKFLGSGLEPGAETQTFTPTFRFAEEEVNGQKLEPSCPEGSKLGTVEIQTPLLASPLQGYLYLASPAPNGEAGRNPFDSLVALYIVAEDKEAGVLVKLAGQGELNEDSLRVATTFTNAPQVPFSDLKIHLFGGERASLSTPASCGGYSAEGVFTPWSGSGPLGVSSPVEGPEGFQITAGAGGGTCPAALPFSPGFDAQGTNTQAGRFTSFQVELSRPDGDQALAGVTVNLPGGIAALLSKVEMCSQAQAEANACPPASQIGEATAVAGLGSEPYVQDAGRVYLTGPYQGAPFGLAIVTPAVAGPFNLGYITVRSGIYVDPSTAAVTIGTPSLPTQIRGIPLQLKRVIVDVNRPEFEFNPTNCQQKTINATIDGQQGAVATQSSGFAVQNCTSLPFQPVLRATAQGHGSKADGTTFSVTVTSGGTNANGVVQDGIGKVDLQLPKQLSSRLPTLQKACAETAFDSNPASCDEGSIIGTATIHTPVLKHPLSGPAYLVSHGNAAFPDVEFVLQGEGITLVLDGKTQIKGQITYSKFESTPDAPFTTFETVLPAGPHGVLTPNVAESKHFTLCGEKLEMPTTITAQDGATITQNTKIAIAGCSEVKSAHAEKLTLAQQLKRALHACQTKYKHAKAKRIKCEKQAHDHYAALALTACRHQDKRSKKQRQTCERAARRRYASRVGKA